MGFPSLLPDIHDIDILIVSPCRLKIKHIWWNMNCWNIEFTDALGEGQLSLVRHCLKNSSLSWLHLHKLYYSGYIHELSNYQDIMWQTNVIWDHNCTTVNSIYFRKQITSLKYGIACEYSMANIHLIHHRYAAHLKHLFGFFQLK